MQSSYYDFISESVLILPFIFLFLFFQKGIYIYGLLGYSLTIILTDLLKKKVFSKNLRPKGAFNCDVFNSDGIQEHKPGFPSGHMSSTTFFVIFFIYILYTQSNLSKGLKILISSFLLIYLILVGISRYQKKCHSVNQIIGGTILGLVIFLIIISTYKFIKN